MTLVVKFLFGSNKSESSHVRKKNAEDGQYIENSIWYCCFVFCFIVCLLDKLFQGLKDRKKTPSAQTRLFFSS